MNEESNLLPHSHTKPWFFRETLIFLRRAHDEELPISSDRLGV